MQGMNVIFDILKMNHEQLARKLEQILMQMDENLVMESI
jgi:hypothetical protein